MLSLAVPCRGLSRDATTRPLVPPTASRRSFRPDRDALTLLPSCSTRAGPRPASKGINNGVSGWELAVCVQQKRREEKPRAPFPLLLLLLLTPLLPANTLTVALTLCAFARQMHPTNRNTAAARAAPRLLAIVVRSKRVPVGGQNGAVFAVTNHVKQ